MKSTKIYVFFIKLMVLLILSGCKEEISLPTDNETSSRPVDSDFETEFTEIITTVSIQFQDRSTGNPTAWDWSFEGGSPAQSNEQNPHVNYTKPGIYRVSLTVANEGTEDSEVKTNYIKVNEPMDPPYFGTVFVDPDILTSSDVSTFQSVTAKGQGNRTMFDRRVNSWITANAHLFEATFRGNRRVEVQVNPEFDENTAENYAINYAQVIGKLPQVLLKDVKTVWIHDGLFPFGGGNNNLLIHIGQAEQYSVDGFLEEVLIHEACHTSLDAEHANADKWLKSQDYDPAFISTYARDFPDREDIAESFLTYLAIRYRADRISSEDINKIQQAIPNRINYFDDQEFNLYPLDE